MKNPSQKDEWSVEPVRLSEREAFVARLALLLQAASRIVDLDAERQNGPERVIR